MSARIVLNLKADVFVDGTRVFTHASKGELAPFLKKVRKRAEQMGFTKGIIKYSAIEWGKKEHSAKL